MAEVLPAMSLFLQYQLGQAIGDLAHNDGGATGAALAPPARASASGSAS